VSGGEKQLHLNRLFFEITLVVARQAVFPFFFRLIVQNSLFFNRDISLSPKTIEMESEENTLSNNLDTKPSSGMRFLFD